MRACNKQVTHHASNHRRRSVVLRQGVDSGGTRPDPADHAGLLQAESDRAVSYGLRIAGVAQTQRRVEEPGVLLLPSGLARTWMASLVIGTAQETASAYDSARRTERCAESCYRPDRRLPPGSTAVARQQRRPPSVSPVYPPLSLSRLQGALRRAPALFCPFPATAPSLAGVFAVHQLCLEDGAARCLHRLESSRAPGEPAEGGQPQPLSDPALGAGAELGQSYPLPGSAPTAARLVRRLSRAAGSAGDPGRSDALSRRLLSRRQLDRGGSDARPRAHGSQRQGARRAQAHLPANSHLRARPPAHLRPAGLLASASDLPSHLRRRASVCRLERRLSSLLSQPLESPSSLRSDF